MAEAGNYDAELTAFDGETAEFRLVRTGEYAKIVFTGADDERLTQLRYFSSSVISPGMIVTLELGAFGAVLNVW